jgi:superfamily I DNA and/or RNA helicase
VVIADVQSLTPGTSPCSVGVLTGYEGQRQRLEEEIGPLAQALHGKATVEFLNVDAAQGREFDLVYYSCVRSNPGGQIGFLADERRLNVALSRARHHLTIVGDLGALSSAEGRFGKNPFRNVISWLRSNSDKVEWEDI